MAALSMLVGLVGLQVVTHFVLDDANASRNNNAPVFEWLARTYVGFFGPGSFDPGSGRLFLGTVVAVGVLLVVGFLGSWCSLRPGPSPYDAGRQPEQYGGYCTATSAAEEARPLGRQPGGQRGDAPSPPPA